MALTTKATVGAESLVLAAADGGSSAIFGKVVNLLEGEVRSWNGFGLLVSAVLNKRVLMGR